MIRHLQRLARWAAIHFLPEPLLYRLWHIYATRHPRTDLSTASDSRRIRIQDSVVLDVFWVDESLGPGPGASLYIHDEEVLRIDCFGKHGLTGHYHINPGQAELGSDQPARLFFPPGDYELHINRASFEIERNLHGMIAMNRHPRIRRVELDQASLRAATQDMRATMLQLVEKHRG